MKQRLLNLLLVTFVAALVGCAEDGVSINESALTIDADNKNAAAAFSIIGSDKSIESDSAPDFSGFTSSSASPTEVMKHLAKSAGASSYNTRSITPRNGETFTENCYSAGSYTYTVTTSSGSSGSISLTYNNCTTTIGEFSLVIDGSATYDFDSDGSFAMSYNISVSDGTDTYSVNGTLSCDSNLNCTYQEDFAVNGIEYRIADVVVSGDATGGWNVVATVYHEELGYVEISGTGLIECSDGGYSAGTITVTDSTGDEVMTITFNSCEQMTVVFDGNSELVDQ